MRNSWSIYDNSCFKKEETMKKIYLIPMTTVLKIQSVQMIAASEDVTLGGTYGGATIQSRRGSSWDDEDDE